MKKLMIIVFAIIAIATQQVNAQAPSSPEWLSSDTVVCVGQELQFEVSITGFESVIWNLPLGLIPTSCMNEQILRVYVDSTFSGGRISVNGWNRQSHHGKSTFKQIEIRTLPGAVPPIIGDTLIELGETMEYQIHPIIGIGPYIWEVPEFLEIVQGQNTMTLKVKVIASGTGEIYVSAQNECGNGPKSKLTIESLTGIPKLNFGGKIYPNPVEDILNIETGDIPESIQIMDLNGRYLQSACDGKKMKCNVSYLPKGIYVLSLIYPDRIETTRFLKQ